VIFDSFLVIKTVLRFSLHAPSACGGRNSAKLGTITGERPNLPNDGRYKLQNLAESCTKPHPLLKASFRSLRHLSSDSRSQGSTQDSKSLERGFPPKENHQSNWPDPRSGGPKESPFRGLDLLFRFGSSQNEKHLRPKVYLFFEAQILILAQSTKQCPGKATLRI